MYYGVFYFQYPKSIKLLRFHFFLKKKTLTVLSSAPAAKYLPLGLKHTDLIYKSPSLEISSENVLIRMIFKK